MLADGVFPTRENCDPQDPQESMLWMLAGMGAMWFPLKYSRLISERLWNLGARPVEEPILKWVPNSSSEPVWGHNPGRWVPIVKQPKPKRSRPPADLPTRETCDLTSPDQCFLWMFVGLPGVKGAPMLTTVGKTQDWSRRLWDLGARPVEEPKLRYVRASGMDANWATSPGRWVDASEPVATDEIGVALAKMSIPQQAELFQALSRWERGERLLTNLAGQVVKTLSAEQRTDILNYMRAKRDAA